MNDRYTIAQAILLLFITSFITGCSTADLSKSISKLTSAKSSDNAPNESKEVTSTKGASVIATCEKPTATVSIYGAAEPLIKLMKEVSRQTNCLDPLDGMTTVNMPGYAHADYWLKVEPEYKTSQDWGAFAKGQLLSYVGGAVGSAAYRDAGTATDIIRSTGVAGNQISTQQKLDSITLKVTVFCPQAQREIATFTDTTTADVVKADGYTPFYQPESKDYTVYMAAETWRKVQNKIVAQNPRCPSLDEPTSKKVSNRK